MTSIRIEGIDRLVAKVGKLAAITILREPMARAVEAIASYMRVYPPPPPNSRYRRTRVLGDSWESRVTRTGEGLQGAVTNRTKYGPFVQSSRFQARIHQGRWQTDQSAVDRYRDAIVGDFQTTIQRVIDE